MDCISPENSDQYPPLQTLREISPGVRTMRGPPSSLDDALAPLLGWHLHPEAAGIP